MPPSSKNPFETLDGRIEALTKAIETLTARTGGSFSASSGLNAEDLAAAVAAGVNQAQASGARTQAFVGSPLPSASDVFSRGLPSAPHVRANQYTFQGTGHRAVAGVIGSKLHQRALKQIGDIYGSVVGPGETLGPLITDGTDALGNPLAPYHEVKDAQGNVLRTAPVSKIQEAQTKIQGVHNRSGLASTILSGIGSGEGLKGVLSGIGGGESMLAEAGPYAAAALGAVEAVKEAGKITQAVRQQLAGYQQDFGGSAASQIGQMASATGFSMSEYFDLGGQAGQLFQGASSLGLNGEARQRALNFGIDMYNKFGMSVANSLKLVQTAAESGNKSLTGLANAIASVSNTARAAGVAPGMAQQQFTNIYSQFSQIAGGGIGAEAVSASITNAQSGLGLQGQNIDFSGLTGMNTISQMAGFYGTNPEAIVAEATAPGGGSQGFNTKLQGLMTSRVAQFMQPYMGLITAYVKQMKAAGVKPSDLTRSNYLQGLVSQILQIDSKKGSGAIMYEVLAAAKSLGVATDINGAMVWAVGLAISQVAPGLGFDVTGSNEDLSAKKLSSQTMADLAKIQAQTGKSGRFEIRGDSSQALLKDHGLTDLLDTTGIGHGMYDYYTKNSAQYAYFQYLQSHGGQTNPVIEAALKDKTLKNAKYALPGGQVVTLSQLIQQHPDQVDKAMVVKGGKGSANVGSLLDYVTGATSTSAASESRQNQDKKKLGTITIDLSPAAKQALVASSPDGLNIITSNAQNIPPSANPITPTGAQPGNQ